MIRLERYFEDVLYVLKHLNIAFNSFYTPNPIEGLLIIET